MCEMSGENALVVCLGRYRCWSQGEEDISGFCFLIQPNRIELCDCGGDCDCVCVVVGGW
jgi:hypothetical protein